MIINNDDNRIHGKRCESLTKLQTSEREEYFEENIASGDAQRVAQIVRFVPLYKPYSVNLKENKCQ